MKRELFDFAATDHDSTTWIGQTESGCWWWVVVAGSICLSVCRVHVCLGCSVRTCEHKMGLMRRPPVAMWSSFIDFSGFLLLHSITSTSSPSPSTQLKKLSEKETRRTMFFRGSCSSAIMHENTPCKNINFEQTGPHMPKPKFRNQQSLSSEVLPPQTMLQDPSKIPNNKFVQHSIWILFMSPAGSIGLGSKWSTSRSHRY